MKKTLLALICAGSCLWAQEGTGPFPAVMEQDPGLPTHTIYRPKDLARCAGKKLPIIAWGEGGCANNGSFYENFLSEIASHGYLAIAIGRPQEPRITAVVRLEWVLSTGLDGGGESTADQRDLYRATAAVHSGAGDLLCAGAGDHAQQ